MKTEAAVSARDKVLGTAIELFYQQGIRAVGVDTIVRESGVTKMTLYRYFPSKDDLVLAYLEDSIESYWQWANEVLSHHQGSPRQQLYDYFDALGPRVANKQRRGCAQLNIKTEYPDPDHPVRKRVSAQKERVRNLIRTLLGEAGVPQPAGLADQLVLLSNGAYSSTGLYENHDLSTALSRAARTLIDANLP